MVKTIFVKPLDGLKVPHPSTGVFISEDGENVEVNSYWTRRAMAKEVEISEAQDADETSEGLSKTKEEEGNKVEEDENDESQGGH